MREQFFQTQTNPGVKNTNYLVFRKLIDSPNRSLLKSFK